MSLNQRRERCLLQPLDRLARQFRRLVTHSLILDYLQAVGLRFDYRADGALIYRASAATNT